MPQFNPKALQFGIAFVVSAAMPLTVLAQQTQSGAELPPPMLDDTLPSAPSPTPAPVVAPAPAAAPTTTSPATTSTSPPPAAAQAAAEPTARSATPAPVSEQQPWYRRMWNSVTGWFSGDEPAAQSEVRAPAAPAAAPPPPPMAQPGVPGRSGPVQGYALDTPERTVRTGVLGECVKTGIWREGMELEECGGAPAAEAVARVEPAPAPAAPPPVTEPEPVEVQPLPAPVEEPQAPLAEPEPAPLPPAPPPLETLTLAADALFALNSDVLRPTAKGSLDELVRKLEDMDYDAVEVTGHTDPTGSTALNERLSRRRAEAVKLYLIEQGVPAEKISARGVGSSMPVVDAEDCRRLAKGQRAACFQPDRRVDIEVTGTMASMAQQ
ncbi:MAG: OmpA family protein [Burkholderiales bacterium]|nr:OmpA family protein [Burkholderiales bacterium]